MQHRAASRRGLDINELQFRQIGDDTVITYDNQTGSITLVDVGASALRVSDFEFV
jgi:hypothetical protein